MTNISIQIVGILAGCITSISMIPQLLKVIKKKDANDISVYMIILLLLGVSMWTIYGFLKQDIPIIVTNCFSFILNFSLLILVN